MGRSTGCRSFPDHCDVIEEATAEYPFRLATSPARTFLNSSFNETPSSRKREGRPTVFVHPDDLRELGLADGAKVKVGSARGTVTLHAKAHEGQRRGVLIAESIWPNECLRRRAGHQYPDRRRPARAQRRRLLPRQPGLDPPGLSRQDERQMNGRVRNRSALRD